MTVVRGQGVSFRPVGTFLSLPGSSGARAFTPDTAANSITGDLDVRIRCALNDWTPAATASLVTKWGSSTNRSWRFACNATTGALAVQLSTDGSATLTRTGTAPTVTDGAILWVRFTLDADDGGGNDVVTFYTGGSGETPVWAQLDNPVTTASGGLTLFNSSESIQVGAQGVNGPSNTWAGQVYRFELYDGIDGTLVNVFDARDGSIGLTSFLSRETNETWNIGGTSTLGGGRVPLISVGRRGVREPDWGNA